MSYTTEEIFASVGQDDKVAFLSFVPGSEAYNEYGEDLTVVFLYNQYERTEMEQAVKARPYSKSGRVKAKYIGFELDEEKVKKLRTEGISSDDILRLVHYDAPAKNTFRSTEKREITRIDVPFESLPNGGDYDWMYGLLKRETADGTGLCPRERKLYLALKYFYEPQNLSKDEANEIFDGDGKLKEDVEYEYLQAKVIKKVASLDERKKAAELQWSQEEKEIQVLDRYLKENGSSIKKLLQENKKLATDLFVKLSRFREHRFNVVGKHPIYLDVNGYLHVFLRHVEEARVNAQFDHKDKFQWVEDDVLMVMEKVLDSISEELQSHFDKGTGKRFSKYGRESIYFQGDYYTVYIEPNGRISTFFVNRKEEPNQ